MKSRIIIVVFLLSPMFLLSQTKNWTPDITMKMKNITAVVPSPDGSKVLYTVREAIMTDDRSEYVNQVFMCNADGSNTIQLTRGEKNSSNPQWSPDGKWASFTSARDGKNNLYILPVDGGESEKITDLKNGIGNYKWSNDGTMVAYTMTDAAGDAEEKNKKSKNDWYFMDEEVKQSRLYVMWINDKDSSNKRKWKKLTKENYNVNSFDWSPDDKNLIYSHGATPKVNDNLYSDISMVDISSATSKPVLKTGASETNPMFSLDGRSIAYSCTEDPVVWGGRSWIKVMELSTGKTVTLAETPDHQPNIIGWNKEGDAIIAGESNKTLFSIYSLSVNGKDVREWSKGTKDYVSGVTLNSTATHMGFLLQNPTKAPEAYISSSSSFDPKKITSINAALEKKTVAKTELIKWKSFDGKEIEALLTYPLNYQAGKKYPLLLNIHGGPAGVFNQTFIAGNSGVYPIAAFAEMDMFVLRPNPRGSSGYGVNFRLANQKDWGGGDYKDLMAGVDHVIKLGLVDSERMGVMGWSYGGFMSSWIVGQNHRFKAASIGAPVVDLSHQNLTDDVAGLLPSYMKTDPWNDWALYDKWSPIRYVQNVKTPVMLQHGEADIRVPFSNAVMYYNALKRRNVPVRLLALPRQPHGPTEPAMIMKTQMSNIEWFERHIGEKRGF